MEGLLVLLGVILLAMPIAVLYLLVAVSRLKSDLRDVQNKLRSTASPVTTQAPEVVPKPSDDSLPDPQTEVPPQKSVWSLGRKDPEAVAPPPDTPSAEPKGPGLVARLVDWLRDNWFYAVSALSLALAGLFLVQYGIENGLLSPRLRVLSALGFGALLIVAGELLRRRFGDGEDSSTAYLPSVMSGAGLVTLFGACLAARQLYGLIEPGPALAALSLVALIGLVLGWFHGPLLAAIGLLGGFAGPFLVGGSSDNPSWLFGYFAALIALGLGIDTMRRWAWVSVLSVTLGLITGSLLWLLDGSETVTAVFMVYAGLAAVMATLFPARGLRPDHEGPTVLQKISHWTSVPRPGFATCLAFCTLAASSLLIVLAAGYSAQTFWIACAIVTLLGALFIFWSGRAWALQDLAIWPLLALAALILVPDLHGDVLRGLRESLVDLEGNTETRMLREASMLLGLSSVLTLMAAWRSRSGVEFAAIWAGVAAFYAPAMGLALELSWRPVTLIGAYPWALHALLMGAIATVLAERFARADSKAGLRSGLAILAALACLAFALTVILTTAALTLALVATVVAAALLDRRLDLPVLSVFVCAGVAAVGWRLVADPGLDWATQAPVLEMLATYGGALAGFLAALRILPSEDRIPAKVMLESAIWSTGGMLASLLVYHVIAAFGGETQQATHWSLGLHATIWAGLALAQLDRLALGGRLIYLRGFLAAGFGLVALGALVGAVVEFNPLLSSDRVLGPTLLNTLLPAYLFPAAVFLAGAWRFKDRIHWAWVSLCTPGLALAALWAGLAIRHSWRGGGQMAWVHGTTQPELYSYTIALLALGAALFYQAMARQSDGLRRAGVAIIGVAVIKVFAFDIAGLQGLTRVFSFLALGLSLSGLAWFNRWVQGRTQRADTASET